VTGSTNRRFRITAIRSHQGGRRRESAREYWNLIGLAKLLITEPLGRCPIFLTWEDYPQMRLRNLELEQPLRGHIGRGRISDRPGALPPVRRGKHYYKDLRSTVVR
jgi:hypothetical protein